MLRTAFVDDCEAAKDFATDDVVRKTDFRGFFPSPYAGRVVYSDPRNGTVQVQWPWGSEQESPTELIKDLSGLVAPPAALDQTYSTWQGARLINDKETLKQDDKWRKGLASKVAARYARAELLARIVLAYEERTKPLWRAACKAHHSGVAELDAFRALSASMADEFGHDAVRLTVANLYSAGPSGSVRVALYWKDNSRRYKVTQKEKQSGKLKCPRCSGFRMKPRVYRQGKKIIMCRDCGFSISPKDLIWDVDVEAGSDVHEGAT